MSLKIGIDGFNMAMLRGTGVATYGVALTSAIAQLGHESIGVFGIDIGDDPDGHEMMFFDRFGQPPRRETRRQKRLRFIRSIWLPSRKATDVPLSPLVDKSGFAERLPAFDRIVSHADLFEIAETHFRLYGRFLPLRIDQPPDIMHWTYPVPIHLHGARNIYTLHDLVPMRLPYATLDVKPAYKQLIDQCVWRSAHICTVSESSRNDIIARYPDAAHKVTNTYQTAPVPDHILAGNPAEDAAMIEGLFDLRHRGYFLFFGALDPKKNIARIVEAYLTSGSAIPLVIVGARSWGTEQENALLGGGRVSVYGKSIDKGILQLDYLPRDLLLRLARGAKAVLFPSLYEGFGLPALEAIRLGTPVISSNISSLPEVVGDAGILIDPYDVRALANAIETIDADPAVAARLVAAGQVQTEKFSDAAYRERLSALYDRVMSAPV